MLDNQEPSLAEILIGREMAKNTEAMMALGLLLRPRAPWWKRLLRHLLAA